MNTFDLQIQSTASDGKHSPRECVQMAKDQGLQVIAITDHDTVAGVVEALGTGRELGVRVIAGIEISVEEHGVHILGYGIDHQNPLLGKVTAQWKEERVSRLKEIMKNLKANDGFSVEWQDVLAEAGGASVLTSPHLVYAVMKKPENKEKLARDEVESKQDFYKKYLAPGGPNDEKREHFSARQAIELIHAIGGAAIWSHPAVHFERNYDGLEKFLTELVGWKIDGVEIFSPSHTEDDIEFLEGLARKYHLLRTAGSDFHATEPPSEPNERGLKSAVKIGDYETFGFFTEDIVPKLDRAIAHWRAQAG